jgi:tRNA uracil 4-sulfurtransferase
MKYIIKYTGEMTTKSRPVRMQFSRQLRKNIARLFRVHLNLVDRAAAPHDPDAVRVEAFWDNLQIELPSIHAALAPEVEAILANTPGVWGFNRVLSMPFTTFDDMVARTVEVYGARLVGKTFVVRCRRVGKHDFNSMDVERYVGGGVLQQTATKGVDLHSPDVVVHVEIRNQELFIVDKSISGIGGFPIGTQDTVMSLLSGGFDSAVSSYLAMTRGLRTHFLFFNLGGREHELAVKEVAHFLWHKFSASHHVQFISVPFEPVVEEILEKITNSQMGVVLKRMMLRAATEIAQHYDEVEALVTGEAVAQVSSQTLTNLAVIDEVTPMLVLRPLCLADKQSIIDKARQIGSAEFSAAIPEYCGVISVKPTTRAKRNRIVQEEQNFDFTVLERAIAARVSLDIRTLDAQQESVEAASVQAEPQNTASQTVVIDIRHPEQQERRPLKQQQYPQQHIPFYRLNSQFPALTKDCHYLLYCDKGVMSRLHASHLREDGFENVGVFRIS